MAFFTPTLCLQLLLFLHPSLSWFLGGASFSSQHYPRPPGFCSGEGGLLGFENVGKSRCKPKSLAQAPALRHAEKKTKIKAQHHPESSWRSTRLLFRMGLLLVAASSLLTADSVRAIKLIT